MSDVDPLAGLGRDELVNITELRRLRDCHDPVTQGHGLERCEVCSFERAPCEEWLILSDAATVLDGIDRAHTPAADGACVEDQQCWPCRTHRILCGEEQR